MTVLEKYQRLEAEGVWRADDDAQRRDVIVSIGDATLTITDMNETALAHWSLPAIERRNPGDRPAIFGPGPDAPETLEIADPEMIAALRKVLRAIRRKGRHPGRLRSLVFGGIVALMLALVFFWLPGALARYTSGIVPQAARSGAGAELLDHVTRLTGQPCAEPAGQQALSNLGLRLFPSGARIFILPSALSETQHLPGGILLASHTLAEDHETPEPLAKALIAEDIRRAGMDPFERLVRDSGLVASIQLLTSGALPEEAIRAHAEKLVAAEPGAIDETVLAEELANADFEKPDAPPLLGDSDWIALQQICGS